MKTAITKEIYRSQDIFSAKTITIISTEDSNTLLQLYLVVVGVSEACHGGNDNFITLSLQYQQVLAFKIARSVVQLLSFTNWGMSRQIPLCYRFYWGFFSFDLLETNVSYRSQRDL